MKFGKSLEKGKEFFFSSPPPSLHSARWPLSPFSPQPSSRASPAARLDRPRPVADCLAPPVGTAPNLPLALRQSIAMPQLPPTNGVVGAPPLVPRPLQIAARPPRAPGCPPLSFSRLPSTEEGRNRRCRGHRDPPSSSSEPSRKPPSPSRLRSDFHRGEPRRSSLSLPEQLISRFLASRALAASSASHGRRPWRPPR